jgi:hypothetical protein
MSEEKVPERSRYRIKAPQGWAQRGFFQRLKDAAQLTDADAFPFSIYLGEEASKQMTEFPINDTRVKKLTAALNAQRDEYQRLADQAEADRDEIIRQAAEQGYAQEK